MNHGNWFSDERDEQDFRKLGEKVKGPTTIHDSSVLGESIFKQLFGEAARNVRVDHILIIDKQTTLHLIDSEVSITQGKMTIKERGKKAPLERQTHGFDFSFLPLANHRHIIKWENKRQDIKYIFWVKEGSGQEKPVILLTPSSAEVQEMGAAEVTEYESVLQYEIKKKVEEQKVLIRSSSSTTTLSKMKSSAPIELEDGEEELVVENGDKTKEDIFPGAKRGSPSPPWISTNKKLKGTLTYSKTTPRQKKVALKAGQTKLNKYWSSTEKQPRDVHDLSIDEVVNKIETTEEEDEDDDDIFETPGLRVGVAAKRSVPTNNSIHSVSSKYFTTKESIEEEEVDDKEIMMPKKPAIFQVDTRPEVEDYKLIKPLKERTSKNETDDDRILFSFPENEMDSVTITVRDVKKCSQDVFLNDSLIDFYMKYMSTISIFVDQQCGDIDSLQNTIHVFTSFLYTRILTVLMKKARTPNNLVSILENDEFAESRYQAYSQVIRWTAGIDVFSKSCIIFPINYGLHWTFAACCFDVKDNHKGFVFMFDSLENSSHKPEMISAIIRMYLNYEYEARIRRKIVVEKRNISRKNEYEENEEEDNFIPEILEGFKGGESAEDKNAFELKSSDYYFTETNLPTRVVDVPKQLDGVNCGVHVLNNARVLMEFLACNYPEGVSEIKKFRESLENSFHDLNFRTEDANKMRSRIMKDIKAIEEEKKTLSRFQKTSKSNE